MVNTYLWFNKIVFKYDLTPHREVLTFNFISILPPETWRRPTHTRTKTVSPVVSSNYYAEHCLTGGTQILHSPTSTRLHLSIFWFDLDRASSLICGNKMPTRCNRGFYCRSYCLLNMFWAPLCPSLGAQEYYTVVAACGIWCCGFQVVGLAWSWGLCVRFAGCCIILLSSWW